MQPQKEQNNILEFVCPSWRRDLITVLLQADSNSSGEEEKFLAHCAKCNICKQKAIDLLEKKTQPKETFKRYKIFAILVATLLVSLNVFYFYGSKTLKLGISSQPILENINQQNLYDQLDTAIDQYLQDATKGLESTRANEIAALIQERNSDPFGTDLVSYYRSVPTEKLPKLRQLRQQLTTLWSYGSGDDPELAIKEAESLHSQFLTEGNKLEGLKVKVVLAKALHLGYKTTKISIANTGVQESFGYPSLNAYFSLWVAKNYFDTPEEDKAEPLLKDVILKAKKLRLQDIEVSAVKSLAGIYHLSDRDDLALSIGQSVLSKSGNDEGKITLLHICSASAFKLKLYSLSKSYMDEAMDLAREKNNLALLGGSYLWLGIMATEKGEYSKASEFYTQALSHSTNLPESAKADLISRVKGYEAKNELAQGNYAKAITYYEISITNIRILDDYKNLECGQLYKGLSVCSLKQGQIQQNKRYDVIANHYLEKASLAGLKANCLFSFVPVACN